MASATVARAALRAPSKGYRRLFVPLLDEELAAEVIADAYGVATAAHTVRARDAGLALLDLIADGDFELVVLGGVRHARWNRRAVFGHAVQQVLRKAPCRVLVVAPPRAG